MITTIIWVIFGILTMYITFINYYNGTSVVEWLGDELGKPVRLTLSIFFSILYGIFGPIGLILVIFLNLDKFYLNNKKTIKFIKTH